MEESSFEVVEASLSDAEGIFIVQKACWLLTYPNAEVGITAEMIEKRFADTPTRIQRWRDRIESQKMWIAKQGGRVIGFCAAVKTGEEHRVASLYVAPRVQSKGVGSALMEVTLAYLGTHKDIFVNVASYNERAIRFYGKFGFDITRPVPAEQLMKIAGVPLPETEMVKRV